MTNLVDVSIYEPDGATLIATVDKRSGVTWMRELNTPGTGQFVVHRDEPVLAANPTLLDEGNVVVFTRISDGFVEKTWKIEAHDPVGVSPQERAGRLTTVSGRGLLACGEKALVWPYLLGQASAAEVRIFGFASPEPLSDSGDTTSVWVAPLGVRQDSDPTARSTWPRPWFDKAAQWIAPTDPTLSAPVGRFYLRGEFTLPADAEILLESSFDNSGEIWIDGERVIIAAPSTPYNWRQNYQFSRTEAAGTHVVSGFVDNAPFRVGALNPTGLLLTVYTTTSTGARDTNVLRSDPSSFLVTTDTPGWTIGAVLIRLLAEGQGRGVTQLLPFTVGFTKSLDSLGNAWDVTDELPLTIGDDLGKIFDQSTELVCDIWMDGYELNAAPVLGTDKTATVVFADGDNVLLSAPTFKAGGKVNAALIHFNNQWLEVTDPATIGDYRAEVFLQLGNVDSVTQAIKTAMASFVETATPEITLPLQTSTARGPQPGTHYDVGDTIEGPGLDLTPTAMRVMSITGTENEGEIRYDNACYPEG